MKLPVHLEDKVATRVTPFKEINDSLDQFDLGRALTDEELRLAGMLTTLPSSKDKTPILKDLDETDDEPPVDVVAAITDVGAYNIQYTHYLKCQALKALMSFGEGWDALEELILKAYVQRRRLENKEYKGDDPNKAFALRIKEQAAEDFVRFIHAALEEAVNTPKPVLVKK